jgi:hypothetical protein
MNDLICEYIRIKSPYTAILINKKVVGLIATQTQQLVRNPNLWTVGDSYER